MEQLTLFKEMEETRNYFGYMVNEEGRECSKCREFKLWHCFSKDKAKTNGYKCNCKDCDKMLRQKSVADPKRIELFNSIERKYSFGDTREDGKVFLSYKIELSPKKNFERWVTKEAYDKHFIHRKNSTEKRKAKFLKIEKKHKRGDIGAGGMKFWKYGEVYATTNFEKWVTKDEFDYLKFNECKGEYLRKSLGKFGSKDEPSDDIIGLNDHDLSCYIESLFEEGMTWKNRGNWEGKWDPKKPKWHVDHTLPLSSVYNLEDKKHLWHYTNLRPMWGNENLAKSNKHCEKELEAFLEERKAESMV